MLSPYLFGFMCLIICLKYLWSRRKWYLLSRKIAVLPGYPFIGSALVFRDKDTTFDKLKCIREKYKQTIGFWLGPKLVIYIYGPEDFQKVLNAPECFNKGEVYRFLANFTGPGIFMLPREEWAKKRKLMNPSFSHKVLLSFFPIFNEGVDILTKKFEELMERGDVTLYESFARCNLDVTCKTTMGVNMNSQNLENDEILQSYFSAKYVCGLRMISPWLQPDILFRLSKWFKVQQKTITVLREFVHKIVASKCFNDTKEQKSSVLGDIDVDSIKKDKNIFIDQAIRLFHQKQFTMEDIYNESRIIMAAAFDTSALTLTFVVQCLAMFPAHQERVIEEVRSIFPNEKLDVTFEDTQKMVYCDMVINETLRLFPAVPLLARRTSSDFKLKDHIIIPKDTEIILDVIGMHRDPDFWGPTANTFDPMRFGDSRRDFHPYLHVPFSKGPQNCIGWRYAMLSMKIFMAKIFRKYRFTTDQKLEDIKIRMDVALATVNDPVVRIHKIA